MFDSSETSMANRMLTPDELATLVPSVRKGRNATAQTIRRWMLQGLRGRFLRYTRVGVIPCATEQDLQDFFAELTRDDESRRFAHVGEPATTPTRAAKKNEMRLSQFKKRAEDLGL